MKIENALKKPLYLGILYVLSKYAEKEITMMHLRFLFIKDHDGIELKTKNGKWTTDGKKLRKTFGTSYIEEKYLRDLSYWSIFITLDNLVKEQIEMKSARNYLAGIIRDLKQTEPFELVIRRPPKKGERATYKLTCEGEHVTNQSLLLWLLKNYKIPIEKIKNIIDMLTFEAMNPNWKKGIF